MMTNESRLDLVVKWTRRIIETRLDDDSYERYKEDLRARDFLGAMSYGSRQERPRLLDLYLAFGLVTADDLRRELLLDTWTKPDFPCRCLPRKRWLEWFHATRFISADGSPPPEEPLTVWRGQVGRTLGLSWTADQEKGEWFHRRNRDRFQLETARLLRVVVQPKHVLATLLVGGYHRGEDEVIVDPVGVVGRYQVEKGVRRLTRPATPPYSFSRHTRLPTVN